MSIEMPMDPVLLVKIRAYIPEQSPLTAEETEAILRLLRDTRSVHRGSNIIVQGRRYDGLSVLLRGCALRYKVIADGRRQVLNVSLPGDLIGYPACFFERALYSVTALSQAQVCLLSFAHLTQLCRECPRVAMALFWATACETAMFGEHLADIGRRSAIERVAHFVLELATRLHAIGMGDERGFVMPLTQGAMADVLGLSVPHVNRMLRRLSRDGLIDLQQSRLQILDQQALAALADFDASYLTRRPAPRAMPVLEPARRKIPDGNGHGPPGLLAGG